ncbi:hypothetical protein ABZP36_031203 [Zizania latifolia]
MYSTEMARGFEERFCPSKEANGNKNQTSTAPMNRPKTDQCTCGVDDDPLQSRYRKLHSAAGRCISITTNSPPFIRAALILTYYCFICVQDPIRQPPGRASFSPPVYVYIASRGRARSSRRALAVAGCRLIMAMEEELDELEVLWA